MPVSIAHRPARPARHRPTRAVLVAVLGALALLIGVVPATAAPESGWLRLAHFSPDTPKVDVYLTSFAAAEDPAVFRSVGYGVLSEYQRVPAGRYSVGMRLAGADPKTPLVITTDVVVGAGKAYTVAGMGRNADLALEVLTDDLTAADKGKARLRVIHAADRAPLVSVQNAAGQELVGGARFATASPYVNIPAGEASLQATAQEAKVASTSLDAASGAVYSLVMLDEDDGVTMVVRNDAQSAKAAPAGGVATGLGGAAGGGVATDAPVLAVLAGLASLVAIGGLCRRTGARG